MYGNPTSPDSLRWSYNFDTDRYERSAVFTNAVSAFVSARLTLDSRKLCDLDS